MYHYLKFFITKSLAVLLSEILFYSTCLSLLQIAINQRLLKEESFHLSWLTYSSNKSCMKIASSTQTLVSSPELRTQEGGSYSEKEIKPSLFLSWTSISLWVLCMTSLAEDCMFHSVNSLSVTNPSVGETSSFGNKDINLQSTKSNLN